MTYLVKALFESNEPVAQGKNVAWSVGQIREVDDSLIARYQNNPAAFTVLSGPGHVENMAALRPLLALPYVLSASGADVSLTGTTAETVLATVTIPGGSMGTNGTIRISYLASLTSNANEKTVRVKFGDTSYGASNLTTTATIDGFLKIRNRNSQSSQCGFPAGGPSAGSGLSSLSITTSEIDTSVDQVLTITGELADIADNITLRHYFVEIIPSV